MHAVSVAVLTACLYAPVPPAKPPEKGPAAIERKLHGPWRSESACGGTLVIKADGKYEHKHQGPGGDFSSGAWELRWDALPPTLVLMCKDATDPAMLGKWESKVEGLNDDALALAPAKASPARFKRLKK
jgi:hypothetical protein